MAIGNLTSVKGYIPDLRLSWLRKRQSAFFRDDPLQLCFYQS